MIVAANRENLQRKPSICGFGGVLDYKLWPNDKTFVENTGGFDKALTNFSPDACDVVALYFYGANVNHDPDRIDWSMKNLLPYALKVLRARGWDQDRTPLIGIPQTFAFRDYVRPRSSDIERQSATYCAAGAIALIPYAWNDSFEGSKAELFNTPNMVEGLKAGERKCRELYWTIK
jgi:hypothetical protein